MYPPNKQKVTAQNTYKKAAKKENTYKKAPKAAKSGFGGNALWLAVGAGSLMALVATSSSGSNVPAPGTAAPSSGTGSGTITPGATTPTTKPTPAPAPTIITMPSGSSIIYLVVDSLNGEGIYQETKKNYDLSQGYGRYKILHLPNHRLVGQWTGRAENNMLQAYIKINGVAYNVWVDAKEVKRCSLEEYQHHKKVYSSSTDKTTAELNTIINFFKNI